MCDNELRIVDYAHGTPVKWVAYSFQDARIVARDGAIIWEGHADDLAAMPTEIERLQAELTTLREAAAVVCEAYAGDQHIEPLRLAAGTPAPPAENKPLQAEIERLQGANKRLVTELHMAQGNVMVAEQLARPQQAEIERLVAESRRQKMQLSRIEQIATGEVSP